MISTRCSRLALVLLLSCLTLFAFGGFARLHAQQAPAKPQVPAKPQTQQSFSIESLEPDAANAEVRVKFSQFVPLDLLRREFKLLPAVRISWSESSYDERGVLHLKAEYRYGTRYLVNLPENLQVEGKRYVRGLYSFNMPDLPPQLSFVDDKSVIELKSRQLLHVKVQNSQAAQLEVQRFPLLLLPLALSAEANPAGFAKISKQLEQAAPKFASPGAGLSQFGGAVKTDKQLFSLAPERNKPRAYSLPLTFREKPETGGLSLVNLPGAGPKVYRITDISLASKTGAHGLLIWATSLGEAAPLPGVALAGITKNMEAFSLGKTGSDGVLSFGQKELEGLSLKNPGDPKPVKHLVKASDILFVLAATTGDASYLRLDQKASFKPQNVRQSEPGAPDKTLSGEIFTERGLYRPGDTVHFKAAVRQWLDKSVKLPTLSEVGFEIVSSRGDSVYSSQVKLSDFGTAAGDFSLPAHLPLGQYTLSLNYAPPEPAAKPQAAAQADDADDDADAPQVKSKQTNRAETTFQVQEFKPPRHFAEIAFKTVDKPMEGYVGRKGNLKFVSVEVGGQYYVGGPLKHGGVRWKIYSSRSSYKVAGYDDFSFGFDGDEKGDLLESGESILDDAGKAEILFPLDAQLLSGKSGLMVVASVVDFDGRVSSATKTFQVEPEYKVGVKLGGKEIPAGGEMTASLVLLDPSGKPVPKAELGVQALERGGVQAARRNEQGDVFWDYQPVWRASFSKTCEIKDGKASFVTPFETGGEFLISFNFRDPNGKTHASAVLVNVEGDSSFQDYSDRNRPYKSMPLYADHESFEPGQKAKVTARPRQAASSYLFTLEREGVLDYKVVSSKEESCNFEFEVKSEHAPNVFVSALGVVKRGDFPVLAGRYDTEAPVSFFGTLNLPVKLAALPLNLQITAKQPEFKYQPGQKAEIEFLAQNKDGQPVQAELTVAVVMESILAMTAFKTPNYDALIDFDCPLGVYTEELRAFLQHQTPFYQAKMEPLSGGDGTFEDGTGLMSKLRKRFEPVPYFNAALRTGADGKASISFTVPDGMTAYRVYAVGLDKAGAHGNAEKRMNVSKDFYLEPGMPDFFTKGDKFSFLVSAVNLSKNAGQVAIEAVPGPGLKLNQPAQSELAAETTQKVAVSGEALTPGDSSLRLNGKFGALDDALEVPLRINTGEVRQDAYYFGFIDGPTQLRPALPAILEKAASEAGMAVELTLSGSPYLRLAPAISYLLNYPYGCVEQTSSGIIGLAAIKDAAAKGLIDGVSGPDVDRYLQKGVARLLSMRLEGGGFAYWPGRLAAHPWGTAYAALALGLAARQGYAVPAGALEDTAKFLREDRECAKTSPALKAYGALALGLAGKLDRKTFAAFGLDWKKLNREGRLAMALARFYSGQLQNAETRAQLSALLGEPLKNQDEIQADEFGAEYRVPALGLLAAQSLLPGTDAANKAAMTLLGGLSERGAWSSTADTGFALLALNEFFRGAKFADAPEDVSLEQPGEPAQSVKLDPKGVRSLALSPKALLKDPSLKVTSQSGHSWVYKLRVSYPRPDISTLGESKGLKVWKEVKNSDGSDTIKVGDLVKVTLNVDAGKNGLRYLAISDPLPAGFVAVNPAFKTEEPLPDSDEPDEFDYFTSDGRMRLRPSRVEMRDDRVLAFQERVYPGVQVFEYFARAVCEGDFVQPSTQAEAMYSPGVHAYSPSGRAKVEARR